MAHEIVIVEKYTKSYTTRERARKAADRQGENLRYLIVPLSTGKFTPVFTNAVPEHRIDLAHNGYMIVG